MALFSKKPKATTEKVTEKATKVSAAHQSQPSISNYGMIKAPHITEKAALLAEHNKYTFKVSAESNKIEIKKAIQNLYKVTVTGVHVISIPAKARSMGRYQGVRSSFKKAIVTLKPGDKIDVASS